MAFTNEQLKKFAHLIRIEVSDEDLQSMRIDSIVEWFDKLQAINTDGIEPMLTPAEHDLPMREDIVTDGGYRDLILANAPDKTGNAAGYFAVPKVIEE